ncbi:DNA gyrase inhibitor YacG [Inquilinus sp.]|jgi:endogenous inhibitor of DNA gyrase (YacG/DUF329 family)|uniref:DNA gyrase inhibitor YacG n=1 Tax=Inquilinus sp. TaxID=1932117 RepID=UPI003784ABC9
MTTTPTETRGRCPICRKPTVQQYRPFCSRRCADIDLGHWFSEAYTVPVKPEDEDEETLQPDEDHR